MMSRTEQPPPLTVEQWNVLEQYACLRVGLEEVRRALRDVLEFNFEPEKRWINTYFLVPRPGISVTRKHIENALEKKREGSVSEKDLVHWATMLLLNDAYELDQKEVDFISDWLNDI